jgi:hypothetical protein
VKTAAKELTQTAIDTLNAAMTPAAPWAARVAAATAILDRGWGKPGQHVGISGALDLAQVLNLKDLTDDELALLERLLSKPEEGAAAAH